MENKWTAWEKATADHLPWPASFEKQAHYENCLSSIPGKFTDRVFFSRNSIVSIAPQCSELAVAGRELQYERLDHNYFFITIVVGVGH